MLGVIIYLLVALYCAGGFVVSSIFIELYKEDKDVPLFSQYEKAVFILELVFSAVFWPCFALYYLATGGYNDEDKPNGE